MRSTVLVLALLVLAMAGSAQAATIRTQSFSEGTEIVVESGDAVENFYTYADSGALVFGRDSAGAPLTAGLGCQEDTTSSPPQVRCLMTGNIKRVRFDGGAGNDVMAFDASPVPVVGDGGPGDDGINNGTQPGNIDGGPGLDYINAGAGGGVINGGSGDDYLDFPKLTVGSDDVRGGDGNDGVNYGNYPAAVNVSLDDAANDGPAGRNQNIHSDVEYVIGSRFDDTLTGGAGDNDLRGRDGNDTLTGGAGTDFAGGEGGDDVIDLADDIAETAECGAGTDAVTVDAVDTAVACETRTLRATDADRDGDYRPLDCDDANPALHHGATDFPGNKIDEDCSGADAPLVDLDKDGVVNAQDCNDNDAKIHPGARDIPKDKIDQDCSGSDADYPRIFADVFVRTVPGVRSRITRLAVQSAPSNSRVEVRCRGRGCPFARKRFKPRRGRVTLTSRFRRSLSAGAVIEVRVLRSKSIAKVVRITMRRNAAPKRQDLCLRPGATRPRAC